MSKRREKENELLSFLSEEERKSYEEFEAKLKAKRDIAVKRQKAEMQFWKKVDEREDEVYQYLLEKRELKNSEQDTQGQMQNPIEKNSEQFAESVR